MFWHNFFFYIHKTMIKIKHQQAVQTKAKWFSQLQSKIEILLSQSLLITPCMAVLFIHYMTTAGCQTAFFLEQISIFCPSTGDRPLHRWLNSASSLWYCQSGNHRVIFHLDFPTNYPPSVVALIISRPLVGSSSEFTPVRAVSHAACHRGIQPPPPPPRDICDMNLLRAVAL